MPHRRLKTAHAVALVTLVAWAVSGQGASASIRHNTDAPGFPPLNPLGNKGATLASGDILDESHYLMSGSGQHVILTDGSSGEDLPMVFTGPACTPRAVLASIPTTTTVEYVLTMQPDGNLVLTRNGSGGAVWQSGTYNNPGARTVLQDDGNLVVYSSTNTPLWASYTSCTSMTSFTAADDSPKFYDRNAVTLRSGHYLSKGAHKLVMQADGNLVRYSGGVATWQSGTSGNPGARAALQEDGNLVIYPPTGPARWSTNTGTAGPVHTTLTLDADGRLGLRKATLTTTSTPWTLAP